MSFFSLFKKPQPSVAFSFDDGYMRWVSVMHTDQGVQVMQYESELLGAGILDEQDRIVDDALFVTKLRSVIAKTKFTETNIVIPDGQAVCFHTHVAKEPPKEMSDVIIDHIKTYCQAHDLLQFSEYICEYDVINQTDFGYDVHVTLVPKPFIAHLSRLFKQSGVDVKYIETAHHAVAKSCINIPSGIGYVAVCFGITKTTISVVNGEHLVSHDVVPVGARNVYSVVEKYLRISSKEAARIVERHGILRTHPDTGLLSEIYSSLAPIHRSIDRQLIAIGQVAYKTFGDRFSVKNIVVYGNGLGVKGIAGFIGEETNLKSQELDIWAGNPNRAPIVNLPAEETLVYAEPLALALVYLK